jgi:hypothetical protein
MPVGLLLVITPRLPSRLRIRPATRAQAVLDGVAMLLVHGGVGLVLGRRTAPAADAARPAPPEVHSPSWEPWTTSA